MRISFVGGGTDLADFYHHSPGRVISTAIDKFSYVTINRLPLMTKKVSASYAIHEMVDHPRELKNDRVREALLHFGILSNLHVGSFSDVPVKTGLGSSSSFSVALMKGLYATQDKRVDKKEVAEAAANLEINLVKEPIGKQDHYAAAFGGLNIFQFNADESVEATPVRLDYQKRHDFENHLLLFYTGITRAASSVLTEQKANTEGRLDTLKGMADSVFTFRDSLLAGNFKNLGEILHNGWLKKKTLASNVTNHTIDDLYNAGMQSGAWGGKVLGAGGGGCIMFIVSPEKHQKIKETMAAVAKRHNLEDFVEVPVKFVQAGVEILMNNDHAGSVAV